MSARLIVNPRFERAGYSDRPRAVLSEADFQVAERTILAWPEYAAETAAADPGESFQAGAAEHTTAARRTLPCVAAGQQIDVERAAITLHLANVR